MENNCIFQNKTTWEKNSNVLCFHKSFMSGLRAESWMLISASAVSCAKLFSFFPLSSLRVCLLCHSFLALVSAEKLADDLTGVLWHVICHFSLVSFNILSWSLIFVSLMTVCLRVFLLEFILPGTLCASWI